MLQTNPFENDQFLFNSDPESQKLEKSSSATQPLSGLVANRCQKVESKNKLLSEEGWAKSLQFIDSNDSILKVRDSGLKASLISPARFQQLQKRANKAMVEGKIYMFHGPKSVVIRVLRQRGWVQVFEIHHNAKNIQSYLAYEEAMRFLTDIQPKENMQAYINRCEETILSLMVAHEPVRLVWLNMRWQQNPMIAALCSPSIIFNKIGDPYFAPKDNLAKTMHQSKLTKENQLFRVQLPRTYLLNDELEMRMFIEDYRNTACLGFVKYIVDKSRIRGIGSLFDEMTWHIPFTSFEFAYNRCTDFLKSLQHMGGTSKSSVLPDWRLFIKHHKMLMSGQGKIQSPYDKDIPNLIEKSRCLLTKIKDCWPYFTMEGCCNVWILKPRYSYAGKGIMVTDNLDEIEKAAAEDYLVQKYVEQPLLIHNAKGDFRQYFLVTRTAPLQVWMYLDSYVRLSTQAYNLNDFHQSIHVTNATIQNQYKVSPERDSRLPLYNVLSSQAFQKYLDTIQKTNEWETKIYPQIKQAIIGCLLANQEHLIERPNNFELFGADFILDEDCTVWLLEINQNPLLTLSNPVNSRLSRSLAEDIFKVVLDHNSNKHATTGRFELIFNQPLSKIPTNRKYLSVDGQYFSKDDIRRQMYNHLIEVSRSLPVGEERKKLLNLN